MGYPKSDHLLANVKCPHCSAALLVAVSGFAGELSVRTKCCSKCEKDFILHILCETSADLDTVPDGLLSEYVLRIKELVRQRRGRLKQLRAQWYLERQEVIDPNRGNVN